ncbi:MAG: pyrimidine/purine nucleoside phosphorylase [Elusimicrobia bacterium]|nr:pyrimidine/purine nucleoside phosphorylase [Elusimicrobiota bacterium]
MPVAESISGVTVKLKANVYFDGKVVSHSLLFPNGAKKTVGLIAPGTFHFNTDAPERMDILAGSCRVKLAGESSWKDVPAGGSFNVPGKSSFDIAVANGLTEYLCSFES